MKFLSVSIAFLILDGAAATCSDVDINDSSACYNLCQYAYGFTDNTSVSNNNGVISCSCSGDNAKYYGTFSCGSSSTVFPTEKNGNEPGPSNGDTDCPTLIYQTDGSDFCEKLNDDCYSKGGVGYASLDGEGGQYQCRDCTARGSVTVEADVEHEAAADASDVSVSGPIFAIYLVLAIAMRLGAMLVEFFNTNTAKATKGKEEKKEKGEDDDKSVSSASSSSSKIDQVKDKLTDMLFLKEKRHHDQLTVYDAGMAPLPPTLLHFRLWYIASTKIVTSDTNELYTLSYFFKNNHELTGLCYGDELVQTKGLRRRHLIFTLVTTYALSLVFASGNFQSGDASCEYDCMDPNDCSSTSTTKTGPGGGDISMDWKASLLVTVCNGILGVGGMNLYERRAKREKREKRESNPPSLPSPQPSPPLARFVRS